MTYTQQLELESEQAREQLADSLEELRARMSPGQIVDQLVDYARGSGGGEFLYNLRQQTVNNPLPIALVGAGFIWLMLGNKHRPSQANNRRSTNLDDGGRAKSLLSEGREYSAETLKRASTTVSESTREAVSVAGDVVGAVSEGLRQATESAASSVKGVAASASGAVAAAYDTLTDGAEHTIPAGRAAAEAGRAFLKVCREQPLVLGGIGLAIGMAVGAAAGNTDTEDRLMGDASDRAKESLRDIASETSSEAKDGDAVSMDATDTAENPGLTVDPHDKKHATDMPDPTQSPLTPTSQGLD